MATTVFTIANQKGGVGKTTTAVNLAAALAERKIHTLLVDLDPQANATSALGVEKQEGRSLYRPLHGEGSALEMITPPPSNTSRSSPSEVDLAASKSNSRSRKTTCCGSARRSSRSATPAATGPSSSTARPRWACFR